MKDRLLVDEREAGSMLRLAPKTLQQWRQRGEGPPHVRVSSRCVRYRLQDLERWAAGLVRGSTWDGDEAA